MHISATLLLYFEPARRSTGCYIRLLPLRVRYKAECHASALNANNKKLSRMLAEFARR